MPPLAPPSLALLVLGAGVGPPLLEQVGHHVAVAPTGRHDQGGHALASRQGAQEAVHSNNIINHSIPVCWETEGEGSSRWWVVGGTWLASLASTSSPRDTSTCTASSSMDGPRQQHHHHQHQSEGRTRPACSRGGPPSLPHPPSCPLAPFQHHHYPARLPACPMLPACHTTSLLACCTPTCMISSRLSAAASCSAVRPTWSLALQPTAHHTHTHTPLMHECWSA